MLMWEGHSIHAAHCLQAEPDSAEPSRRTDQEECEILKAMYANMRQQLDTAHAQATDAKQEAAIAHVGPCC